MDVDSTDFASAQFISFRLGGQRRYCSLYEFGCRLGLYSTATAVSFAFQQHLSTGLVSHSDDFHAAEFWPTVAEGDYHADVVVSSIRSTAHRFLARYTFYSSLYYISISNNCTRIFTYYPSFPFTGLLSPTFFSVRM